MVDAAPPKSRVATALLIVATAALVALHVLPSTRIPLTHPVSAYALGRHAWLWRVAVIAFGGTMLVQALGSGWHHLSRADALLATTGVGLLVLTVFPTDPWYPWEHMPTLIGFGHLLGTGLAFAAFSVASTTSARRDLRLLGRAFVGLLLLAMAGVGVALLLGKGTPFVGVIERGMLGAAVVWIWMKLDR